MSDPSEPSSSGPLVLDSSFVLDYLEETAAAVRWRTALAGAFLPSVAAGEVFYKVHERSGVVPESILGVLRALGVEIVDVTVATAALFPVLRQIDAARRAEQKRNGERAASLSMVDLCVLGGAAVAGRAVLTADRHWSTLAPHGLTVAVHDFRSSSRL